jgi:CheY-like chemotaxis protein
MAVKTFACFMLAQPSLTSIVLKYCGSRNTMSARIMVINNDERMRDLVDLLLTEQSWIVLSDDYAHTNLAAVQQLQPALIILDIDQTQEGTGWGFLQLLKMEDKTAMIPVVVCTTAVTLSLEIEGYLAGHHIRIVRKPFDTEPIILLIKQLLASTIPLEIPLTLDTTLPILVVDDNGLLRDNLATILRLEGYKVVTAANGLLALNEVTHALHRLILLDITMPVMTGLEFLTAYAQQPGWHSPVIVLSAVADSISEVLPPFVIQVITKPYPVNDLLSVISKHTQPV